MALGCSLKGQVTTWASSSSMETHSTMYPGHIYGCIISLYPETCASVYRCFCESDAVEIVIIYAGVLTDIHLPRLVTSMYRAATTCPRHGRMYLDSHIPTELPVRDPRKNFAKQQLYCRICTNVSSLCGYDGWPIRPMQHGGVGRTCELQHHAARSQPSKQNYVQGV
jgi:hypothetical protein